MKILSICTSAGLLDKAFIEAGHEVIPGCEIMEHKRRMYHKWCGEADFLCHDIYDLPGLVEGQHFDAMIGGPSCQSKTILRAIRKPKFPDLTPGVQSVLNAIKCKVFLFENVVPIEIEGATHTKLNAMNFPENWKGRDYHQSRERWFTHSGNLVPP